MTMEVVSPHGSVVRIKGKDVHKAPSPGLGLHQLEVVLVGNIVNSVQCGKGQSEMSSWKMGPMTRAWRGGIHLFYLLFHILNVILSSLAPPHACRHSPCHACAKRRDYGPHL